MTKSNHEASFQKRGGATSLGALIKNGLTTTPSKLAIMIMTENAVLQTS